MSAGGVDQVGFGGPTILLAPDSFKESLTAKQACEALEAGLRQGLPQARCIQLPMADGGEGTVQSLVDATGGSLRTTTVSGPLGDPVEATWGVLGDGSTAVIEMAQASGIGLVPASRRDIRRASTRGVGELVIAALDAGVRHIILGIGGSATNDAGSGFAMALGVRLLDTDGRELAPGGAALANLAAIDLSGLDARLAGCTVEVACDVTNPLCGKEGASAVYGPQKGATPHDIAELDAALAHFASIVERDLGRQVADIPGAGAAGGLGAGLLAFTPAELRRGIGIVIDASGLRERVREADLVITGEGRIDCQTRFGKTPQGVADVAREAGVPVIAVAGSLGPGAELLTGTSFDAILPAIDRLAPLDETLARAAENLTRTARTVGALLALGQGVLGPITREPKTVGGRP